jgi:hypothetical protein
MVAAVDADDNDRLLADIGVFPNALVFNNGFSTAVTVESEDTD